MVALNLSPDELLSTTRSVRRRLDLDRPVELHVIRECLALALQAPTGGNAQGWHFVVVTDRAKKQALADLYRQAWAIYSAQAVAALQQRALDATTHASFERIGKSAAYLAEHLHEVPVLVIACVAGRVEQPSHMAVFQQASIYGSILPATWSFMLAARARGLASCWTTLHLMFEAQVAQVLGIPYESITQATLIPVAYPKGTAFRPAARKSLDEVLHMDGW
ncbi:MAG TPA: nitroreductase family protein [Roseiflexaceae bacterium]|nr:nitroreductase family protein [Roseiflexaceae bacterium]